MSLVTATEHSHFIDALWAWPRRPCTRDLEQSNTLLIVARSWAGTQYSPRAADVYYCPSTPINYLSIDTTVPSTFREFSVRGKSTHPTATGHSPQVG